MIKRVEFRSQEGFSLECNLFGLWFKVGPMDIVHNRQLGMNLELIVLQGGLYVPQNPEVVVMRQEHASIGI
jgi:hypothetical protein